LGICGFFDGLTVPPFGSVKFAQRLAASSNPPSQITGVKRRVTVCHEQIDRHSISKSPCVDQSLGAPLQIIEIKHRFS
jgi:hypothetical protein